jgi:signal transduction histidine kinase
VSNTEILVRKLDSEFIAEPFDKFLLLSDVIFPVRDQMNAFLKRKKLDRSSINLYSDEERRKSQATGRSILEVSGWRNIPYLYLRLGSVQQVFFNLFANAIKYGWQSKHEFRIDVVPYQLQGVCGVCVRDWGIGIDSDEAELIFDLGVRGKSANRYDPYGHGYGLAICREIMQVHGGGITLTSLRNPTEFTLSFPLSLRSRAPGVRD